MRDDPADATKDSSVEIVRVVQSDVDGHVEDVHQFVLVSLVVVENVGIALFESDE